MPNPTPDLAAVRARVDAITSYDLGIGLTGMDEDAALDFASDIRTLLAALDAAEAERDRLKEDAVAMTDGLAEILEVVNMSAGPLNLNATENDMWSEMYDAGLLTKFDAACDVAQRLDARRATPTETPQ